MHPIARFRSAQSADPVAGNTQAMRSRVSSADFKTGWRNMPPYEQVDVVQALSTCLGYLKRNEAHTDDAVRAAHFLMGRSPKGTPSSWPAHYAPSPLMKKLLQKALNTEQFLRTEKPAKAIDKLELLLVALLSGSGRNKALFQWVFESNDLHSVLHSPSGGANEGLNPETRAAITQFKMALLELPAASTTPPADYYKDLYHLGFHGHGQTSPENGRILRQYVMDLMLTSPEKFFLNSPGKSEWLYPAITSIAEEAFFSLSSSADATTQLRDALVGAMQGTATEHIRPEPGTRSRPSSAQTENLALRSRARNALQSIIVPLLFGKNRQHLDMTRRFELGHDFIIKITSSPAAIEPGIGTLAIAFFDHVCLNEEETQRIGILQKALVEWAAQSGSRMDRTTFDAIRFKYLFNTNSKETTGMPVAHRQNLADFQQALIRQSEKILFAEPGNARERDSNRVEVSNFVRHYLQSSTPSAVEAMGHGTMLALLQKGRINDPEQLQQIAARLLAGRIPFDAARPLIDAHGPEFLIDLLAGQRQGWMPLLIRNPGLFSETELVTIASESEILIPMSLLQADLDLARQLTGQLADIVRKPLTNAWARTDIAQPVIARIQEICDQHAAPGMVPFSVLPKLLRVLCDTAPGRSRYESEAAQLNQGRVGERYRHAIPANAKNFPEWRERVVGPVLSVLEQYCPELPRYKRAELADQLQDVQVEQQLLKATLTAMPSLNVDTDMIRSVFSRESSLESQLARLAAELGPAVEYALEDRTFRGLADLLKTGRFRSLALGRITDALDAHAGPAPADGWPADLAHALLSALNTAGSQKQMRVLVLIRDRLPSLPPEQRQSLLQALYGIDFNKSYAQAVRNHLEQILPSRLEPAVLAQMVSTALSYTDWTARVHACADQADDAFSTQIEALDRAYADKPGWAALVVNTLPYRTASGVEQLLADGSLSFPEETRARLAFVKRYTDLNAELDAQAGLDSTDSEQHELLKLFAVRANDKLALFQIGNLHVLNSQNMQKDPALECFKLLKPEGASWTPSAVTLENSAELDLPTYLQAAIKSCFSISPAFGSTIGQMVMDMAAQEDLPLTNDEKEILRNCFQESAVVLGRAVTIPPGVKASLVEHMRDQQFLGTFTEFAAEVGQKNGTAAQRETRSLLELMAGRRGDGPDSHLALPKIMLDEISHHASLRAFQSAIDTRADSLFDQFRQRSTARQAPGKHDMFFMLGTMLASISSSSVLGHHTAEENRAFVRFRLMGAYCLARCVAESDALSSGGLSSGERSSITFALSALTLTRQCSGEITLLLNGQAEPDMKPYADRVSGLLRSVADNGVA